MQAAIKQQIENFYAANKAAIDDLASYLSVPPLWLVAVFHMESGLNTQATNANGGAVGLNQMMPSTLGQYGLTSAQYKAMSVAQQVEVMKQFFKPIKGKVKRLGDLYLYNFYPVAVINNYPMDYAIGQDENFTTRYGVSLNKIYDQNKVLDYNNDKRITRQDVTDLMESKYDDIAKLAPTGGFFFNDLFIDFKTNWIVWVIVLVLVVIAVYVAIKRF